MTGFFKSSIEIFLTFFNLQTHCSPTLLPVQTKWIPPAPIPFHRKPPKTTTPLIRITRRRTSFSFLPSPVAFLKDLQPPPKPREVSIFFPTDHPRFLPPPLKESFWSGPCWPCLAPLCSYLLSTEIYHAAGKDCKLWTQLSPTSPRPTTPPRLFVTPGNEMNLIHSQASPGSIVIKAP